MPQRAARRRHWRPHRAGSRPGRHRQRHERHVLRPRQRRVRGLVFDPVRVWADACRRDAPDVPRRAGADAAARPALLLLGRLCGPRLHHRERVALARAAPQGGARAAVRHRAAQGRWSSSPPAPSSLRTPSGSGRLTRTPTPPRCHPPRTTQACGCWRDRSGALRLGTAPRAALRRCQSRARGWRTAAAPICSSAVTRRASRGGAACSSSS
mmetsp:Transcript_2569/g.8509  ORF Transcript_2569/g.8509 Transcript_2569/m.8509 type:complete len:211 (+) Transcript_2569:418-1050(+)